MEEILKYILRDVSDLLRFAETKSATLVAGNGLVIFGLLRIIDFNILSLLELSIVIVFLGQLTISLTICIVSVIPSVATPWLFRTEGVNEDDNLLFYMHIAKYTPHQYLSALADSKETENQDHTKLELLFARQIIEISVVARRKFKLLKIALWLTISSVITPIGAYLLFKVKKQRVINHQ